MLKKVLKLALGVSISAILVLIGLYAAGIVDAVIAAVCILGLIIMAGGDVFLLVRYSRKPADTDLPSGD